MRKVLLALVLVMIPLITHAETLNIDGTAYPRDPFLTPREQIEIFQEIKREWLEFHRKSQPETEDAIVEKPTEPTNKETDIANNKPEFPGLSVDAILSSLDINGNITKWVLVSGKLLREGDIFNNIAIEKIGNDWVVVRWMGETKRIKIGEKNGGVKEKSAQRDSEETRTTQESSKEESRN